MADQITTAAKHRLSGRFGRLSGEDMNPVEHLLQMQLGLTWSCFRGTR